MARFAVLLCCALVAVAAFSSFAAAEETTKKVEVDGKTLSVTIDDGKPSIFKAGEAKNVDGKDCTRVCKETCQDKCADECKPVMTKKCKEVKMPVKKCKDVTTTKTVKKCKNSCDSDSQKSVTVEMGDKKSTDITFKEFKGEATTTVSAHKGRKLSSTVSKSLSGLAISASGAGSLVKPSVCKEVCEDMDEEVTEEKCEKSVEVKEKCEDIEDEKCTEKCTPYCKTECAITCGPKAFQAIGAASSVPLHKVVSHLLG